MSLEKYKEMISRCYKCGYCKFTGPVISQTGIKEFPFYHNCPSYEKFNFETYTGGGRAWLGKGLLDGNLKWNDHLAKIIYACTTCGNCSNQCIYEIGPKIVKIIEALREEAVKNGIGPMPEQKRFGEHVAKEHNPYLELHRDRLKWLPENIELQEKADLLYFVGCTSSYRQTEIAQTTVNILNQLGIDYIITPDEWCCGSPLLRTGQVDTALEHAKHNVELIQSLGAKTVVTSCAGCYHTLKADYPTRFKLYPRFRVLHSTEFLEKLVREGKFEFTGKLEKKVTYHDPCHLGRRSRIIDPPRNLLKSLPGIELIEMKRNKENSLCCGAGGGVRSAFSEWSLEMAQNRIDEALETKAEIIASACPFCKRNLSDAVKNANLDLEVLDVVEIMSRCLGA